MSNYLEHKGYLGTVEYSSDDELLFGKVQFVDSLLAYDGKSADKIKQAFEDVVDSYLEFCIEVGKSPEKPCSGTFNVRVGSLLHKKIAKEAFLENLNLNEFVIKALELAVDNKPKTVNHLHTHLITSTSSPVIENLIAGTDRISPWGNISARAQ